MELLEDSELTSATIGTFFDLYNALGYGHSEAIYARGMEIELTARGLHVVREAPIEVRYKGTVLGELRADLLVESRLLVELKAGPLLEVRARQQLLSYLRAASFDFGLLLFFGPRPEVRRVTVEPTWKGRAPRFDP